MRASSPAIRDVKLTRKETGMKKVVSIARALKEKNRVAGRLSRARAQIESENSCDKRVPRGIDVEQVFALSRVLRDQLISIKTAIALANKPIVSKIIELDEVKSEIAYLNGLNVREGRFVEGGYGSRDEAEIEAVIRKPRVLSEVAALQARADRLQDELDEFNATSRVEIEIE